MYTLNWHSTLRTYSQRGKSNSSTITNSNNETNRHNYIYVSLKTQRQTDCATTKFPAINQSIPRQLMCGCQLSTHSLVALHGAAWLEVVLAAVLTARLLATQAVQSFHVEVKVRLRRVELGTVRTHQLLETKQVHAVSHVSSDKWVLKWVQAFVNKHCLFNCKGWISTW